MAIEPIFADFPCHANCSPAKLRGEFEFGFADDGTIVSNNGVSQISERFKISLGSY
jgi:hypothetical protein